MKVMLSGLQDMNFPANDGKIVDGVKLHYNLVDPNVIGRGAFNQFVPRHVFDTFSLGSEHLEEILGTEVEIVFNNKGKIVGLNV